MDPITSLAAAGLLITVFLVALTHKLRDMRRFHGTLVEYRLLPAFAPGSKQGSVVSWILWLMAWCIVAAETAVCLLLLFDGYRSLGAKLSILLLAFYTLGIALNLLRGRQDMDCGCTWGSEKSCLSMWLLLRNGSLMAVAWSLLMAPPYRALGWADWLITGLAVLALVLLYFAAERLIGNWSRLRTLRMT